VSGTGRYVAETGITKVQKSASSTANILELNGANATTEWPANFRSGDVLKIQFKTLKTGDAIMILFTPRSTVLKRVMVL